MLLRNIKFLKNTKRDLELVCLPHFLHHFWIQIFFLLYSVNWSNSSDCLSLLCEMLVNMCIVIVSCSVCKVNFEINLSSLIKSGQKLITSKTKRAFNMKKFFITFKEFSITRNSVRPPSGLLKCIWHPVAVGELTCLYFRSYGFLTVWNKCITQKKCKCTVCHNSI